MAVDLVGKTVCITGALSTMTRAEASAQLEALGAIVSKSVTKETDILFCGARAGMKLEKAEEYEIPIYEEAEFNLLVGDDAATKRAAAAAAKPLPAGVQVLKEIDDGEVVEVQGSAAAPYRLTNTGGVYSCSCPAWRNQSAPIDLRSCKHLAQVRGQAAETARVGRQVNSVTPSKTGTPKVLLAQKWEPHIDPAGYWMSEKLDGVRAIWDGKTFMSRQGNPFFAPDWFTANFPSVPLDGELWIGRGQFQKTVSVVRRQDKSQHWKDIRFVMFDAPDHGGTFEERLQFMHDDFDQALEYASVLDHEECRDAGHLKDELARIEALGGEGVMLREPKSLYIGNRSTTLLKVKSFHDAEAVVIGYKGGQGKHRNRVGALELVTPDGVKFFAGTGLSDAERKDPPKVGTLVTYRYQELTDAGVPRFPSYVGIRIDGKWTGPAHLLSPSSTAQTSQSTAPATRTTSPAPPPAKSPATSSAGGTSSANPSAAVQQTPADVATYSASGAKATLEKAGDQVSIRRQGGTVTLKFSALDAAKTAFDDVVALLLSEGYGEAGAGNAAPASPASPPRRFEFDDGTSHKFWEISVAGNDHTVRFGKAGVTGTSKTKTFATNAEATANADKLIRQKTNKGYVET